MVGGGRDANPVTCALFGVHETHNGAFDRHAVVSHLEFQSVAKPEAKNLEAISKAIDQHNRNCPYPAAEVRMNPFEVERLGWEEVRGLPVVPDSEIGTGRFRIVCSRELDDAGLEETEAIGQEVETAVPVSK